MTKVLHPKCGKRFANAASVGHCAECCETFVGLGAYDKHLSRDDAGKYTHRDPAVEGLWWLDDRGYWHHGPRLTEAQKAELFPKPTEAKEA